MEDTNKPEMAVQTPVVESHAETVATPSPVPEQQEENKRELNKMSVLERERNDAKAEAEEARRLAREAEESSKAIREDLNSTFSNNPEAYETFAKGYNQLHPDRPLKSYNEVYGRQAPAPAYQTPVYQPVPTEQVASQAAAQVQAQMALESFTDEHPEFKPQSGNYEGKAMMDKVTKLADFYVNQYGMRPLDALKEAHASLPENRGKQAIEAKEVGELVGTAKAYASNVGVTSAPSGSGGANIPTSSAANRLNTSQRKRYDELMSKDPKIAQRYLDNALNQ
jgi:hypothetical protein